MQWANAPNAGFSPADAQPWLPVNPNSAHGVNVGDQVANPASLLRFYRRLIRVRRRTPALRYGDCRFVDGDSDDMLAFVRTAHGGREACLVVLNMSDRGQRLRYDAEPMTDALHVLFSSRPRPHRIDDPRDIAIEPFEIYIADLE
jgi:glycosidase